MDALALACVLAKRNKGKVYAVYVIEVARPLPLDADLSPDRTVCSRRLLSGRSALVR